MRYIGAASGPVRDHAAMESRNLMSRRSTRVALALLLIALLAASRDLIHWIESAYPLDGGPAINAIEYVLLAALMSVIGAVTLGAWILPGWTASRIACPGDSPAVRALRAIVIAFVIQPLVIAAVVTLAGDMQPEAFRRNLLIGQGALLIGSALLPVTPSARQEPGLGWSRDRSLLLAAYVFGIILLTLPGIAWSDYNPDGIELLTLGRSLASYAVPRLWHGNLPPTDLGMITAAFPIAWLVAVGGVGETAARLPAVGYAVCLALGVVALAEYKARRALSSSEFAVVLLGSGAVFLTIALNTAYDPYSTDIASPASIDLLAMVFLLAVIYFVVDGAGVWVVASAVLLSLTRPTALLLAVLLAVAVFVVERDWRSPRLRLALLATAAALLVSVVHRLALGAAGGGTLERMRYLRFDDWARLRFLLIPSGLIPVLAWLGWRRMDAWSRVLALVAIGYFAFFYCMAFYSLHHFAPAMLLPLVTFWRGEAQRESQSGASWRLATVLGVILAIVAALPREFTVFRDTRRIASTISYEVGDYPGDFAGVRRAFTGSQALGLLFASPYVRDPQATRITQSLALMHYSSMVSDRREPAQYVVRATGAPAPDGTTSQGSKGSATLYVRDPERWRTDRASPPDPAPRSRWYDVPRPALFEHLGLEAGLAQIDLVQVVRRVKTAVTGSSR